MLFNSISFLVFFPVVTGLYFLLPHRFRWMLLLAASCYFYMAFVPVYILILGFTIVVDYFAGIWIEGAQGRRRKLFLVLSIIANVGVLAAFKYYNFLNDNLTALLGGLGQSNPVPYLDILLPIGLSFHTFQAMSYTIEVYRGNQKAEHHFGIYSLYVMFYPQLVAGPIERPQNLLPQFHQSHSFDYQRVVEGLRLMLWGMFKKVVIADRLALYVDQVYGHPGDYTGLVVVAASYFFAIQIYCDFSGYSDIAIGSARVMGFKLMQNFNLPYFSSTIREFWSRWHISLSTWFRDYLYIPLGGNRVSERRWMINLLIVFMVSGLWHGAKWTFIIWGTLHGLYIIGEIVLDRSGLLRNGLKKRWFRLVAMFITFNLVVIGWVFFRAGCVTDALQLLKSVFSGPFLSDITLGKPQFAVHLVFGAFFILALLFIERITFKETLVVGFARLRPVVRWVAYVTIILAILWFGVFTNSEFIYFQF